MDIKNGISEETSTIDEFQAIAASRWDVKNPTSKRSPDMITICAYDEQRLPNNNEDITKIAKYSSNEINCGPDINCPISAICEKFSEREQAKESKKRKNKEISEFTEKKHCSRSIALKSTALFPHHISFDDNQRHDEQSTFEQESPSLSAHFNRNCIREEVPFFFNDHRHSPRKHLTQLLKDRGEQPRPKSFGTFLQYSSCSQLGDGIMKCMECRNQRTLSNYCRFFAFRKIRYDENGLRAVGFSEMCDIQEEDTILWKSLYPISKPYLTQDMAKYIIERVAFKFLEMLEMEREAIKFKNSQMKLFWKRPCHQIREMCDVCNTTLFNINWVCAKCGFSVCIDCFKLKLHNSKVEVKEAERKWLTCASNNNENHSTDSLIIAQIIPGYAFWTLGKDLRSVINQHDLRVIKGSDEASSHIKNIYDYLQKKTLDENKDFFDIPDKLFSSIPHFWIDNQRVLQILYPRHPNAVDLFRSQWSLGIPVIASNCNSYIDDELWHPKRFTEEVGNKKATLVNCRTHEIIEDQLISEFWDGFECESARMPDIRNKKEHLILKLKDWPPTEDFAKILPKHFSNLMEALPFPEYTHRDGVFNLTSRLPDFFVRPDLGPKMYNAYGSAKYPNEATTNLHLDVSDAANLMLYVGIVKDDANCNHHNVVMNALRNEGVCNIQIERAQKEIPGALWHIFDADDADKIRAFLRKVAQEKGEKIEANHDPIHDQSSYLDVNLRKRLKDEYDIEGYCLVQFLGDAVFIPGGAPHQVRNLHSCIKAAEDFVSPEHLHHSFRLTNEFRQLSDTHSNHEDKLQIKNITYQAIKDAVAVLKR
ncbi:DgyrCDS4945 [Dimorphilus gyrociliatus]|uniref:DgyrCDS4945 n=1 Tax=Dimorphilus gyrociliatus TaxID=2664684 RepID=A0A7I8VIZ6_9ANNE|nr:DgyrCDS4945 [Dimorphilus gyrociliatus]